MGRPRGWLLLALLASPGVIGAACVTGKDEGSRVDGADDPATATQPAAESSGSADVIDVSSGSHMSLSLLGGLGPILSEQTVTKASVSMSDLQLVDASGSSVALSDAPFTGDLIALQDHSARSSRTSRSRPAITPRCGSA